VKVKPPLGDLSMSDNIMVAYERALDLVGVDYWGKLSDPLKALILDAVLSALDIERDPEFVLLPQDAQPTP
jgi:hypothetical protein